MKRKRCERFNVVKVCKGGEESKVVRWQAKMRAGEEVVGFASYGFGKSKKKMIGNSLVFLSIFL